MASLSNSKGMCDPAVQQCKAQTSKRMIIQIPEEATTALMAWLDVRLDKHLLQSKTNRFCLCLILWRGTALRTPVQVVQGSKVTWQMSRSQSQGGLDPKQAIAGPRKRAVMPASPGRLTHPATARVSFTSNSRLDPFPSIGSRLRLCTIVPRFRLTRIS